LVQPSFFAENQSQPNHQFYLPKANKRRTSSLNRRTSWLGGAVLLALLPAAGGAPPA
jgi:hypothetical protein